MVNNIQTSNTTFTLAFACAVILCGGTDYDLLLPRYRLSHSDEYLYLT